MGTSTSSISTDLEYGSDVISTTGRDGTTANGAVQLSQKTGSVLSMDGRNLRQSHLTISFWVYWQGSFAETTLFDLSDAGYIEDGRLTVTSAGELVFYRLGRFQKLKSTAVKLPKNTWSRVAFSRESTAYKVYVGDDLAASCTDCESASSLFPSKFGARVSFGQDPAPAAVGSDTFSRRPLSFGLDSASGQDAASSEGAPQVDITKSFNGRMDDIQVWYYPISLHELNLAPICPTAVDTCVVSALVAHEDQGAICEFAFPRPSGATTAVVSGNRVYASFAQAAPSTWTTTKDFCAGKTLGGMSGWLATANSASETTAIVHVAESTAVPLGGSNAASGEGTWSWTVGPTKDKVPVSGSACSLNYRYCNWAAGASFSGTRNYIEAAATTGQWSSVSLASTYSTVVCEFIHPQGFITGEMLVVATTRRRQETDAALTAELSAIVGIDYAVQILEEIDVGNGQMKVKFVAASVDGKSEAKDGIAKIEAAAATGNTSVVANSVVVERPRDASKGAGVQHNNANNNGVSPATIAIVSAGCSLFIVIGVAAAVIVVRTRRNAQSNRRDADDDTKTCAVQPEMHSSDGCAAVIEVPPQPEYPLSPY